MLNYQRVINKKKCTHTHGKMIPQNQNDTFVIWHPKENADKLETCKKLGKHNPKETSFVGTSLFDRVF